MNKKSIGALMLSAALLVGGTASTLAYFIGSASTEVISFTTGNVKVEFDRAQETPWKLFTWNVAKPNEQISVSESGEKVTNAAPGDDIRKSFIVKNTGSLDAKVRLSIVSELGEPLPGGDSYPYGNWVEWKAYKVTTDGTQIPVQIQYDIEGEDKKYAILPAVADNTLKVEVIVKVSELLGNTNFDKTFNFKVKAEATQWNNPGWTEEGTN
jgi:hypothetical protein